MKQYFLLLLFLLTASTTFAQDEILRSLSSSIEVFKDKPFYRYGSTTIFVDVPYADPNLYQLMPTINKGCELYVTRGKVKVVPIKADSVHLDIFLKNKNTGNLTYIDSHHFKVTENPWIKEEWKTYPLGHYPDDLYTMEEETAYFHYRKYLLEDWPAPSFEAVNMEGKKVNLENYKGKVVFMNFWFVGCVNCLKEMQALKELQKQFNGQEVHFLSMCPDKTTDIQKAMNDYPAFQSLKRITPTGTQLIFETVPDIGQLENGYNIMGYPTSMIIDKTGTIRYISLAFSEGKEKEFAKIIQSLL